MVTSRGEFKARVNSRSGWAGYFTENTVAIAIGIIDSDFLGVLWGGCIDTSRKGNNDLTKTRFVVEGNRSYVKRITVLFKDKVQ